MTANNSVVNANKTIALNISPNIRNNNDTLSYVLWRNCIFFEFRKILGITIDYQQSFETYIGNLESKFARSVGVFAKLSYYLPHNTLLTLYYSLVHSHFLHTLPAWASTHKTHLAKLQKLQNKAVRIISKTRIRDSISQQYYKFKVLKIEDLFTFETAKIMHQFTHKKHRIIGTSATLCVESPYVFFRTKLRIRQQK